MTDEYRNYTDPYLSCIHNIKRGFMWCQELQEIQMPDQNSDAWFDEGYIFIVNRRRAKDALNNCFFELMENIIRLESVLNCDEIGDGIAVTSIANPGWEGMTE